MGINEESYLPPDLDLSDLYVNIHKSCSVRFGAEAADSHDIENRR